MNATGTQVYVTNEFSNSISVIDTAINAVVATVPVGNTPTGVAVNSLGTRAYVSNFASNNVSVIDTGTDRVIATVGVGHAPFGLTVSPDGTRVYVANSGGSDVSVIDAGTNTVVATVAVGAAPRNVAGSPTGTRIYASNGGASSVAVIDTTTNATVATVPVGSHPLGIAVNPTGTRVYVANNLSNSVSVIDTSTNTVMATVTVGDSPSGLAVNPAGSRIYVANSNTNNVSVIDAASNAVIAAISVGNFPQAFGQFIGPAIVTPPGTKPDLNQHGLTGSWYEPATSGQGVEVEVFPDMSAPGTGLVFVSWFTYDTVVGGAERQRWYTASGPVVSGQPTASLTIYQNTGGNFNAPPITIPQQLGTATLSFDTCSTGQLTYNFTDGTSRAGVIPLTRIAQNVTCSTSAARPVNADFALSGNWYDPTTSGQGFTVEVNPNNPVIFAAWYTYAPNGATAGPAGQRWYTALPTVQFVPGSRSIPLQIYEDTGGLFDAPTVPLPHAVTVGSGTITFLSCSAARFVYNFTGGTSIGLSGTINLSRVGPIPPGCIS